MERQASAELGGGAWGPFVEGPAMECCWTGGPIGGPGGPGAPLPMTAIPAVGFMIEGSTEEYETAIAEAQETSGLSTIWDSCIYWVTVIKIGT